MELFSINIDGTNLRQITHLGGSNWAPFYLDDNKKIVFSTNFNATGHFGSFDLYVVNEDGSGLERVSIQINFSMGSIPIGQGNLITLFSCLFSCITIYSRQKYDNNSQLINQIFFS